MRNGLRRRRSGLRSVWASAGFPRWGRCVYKVADNDQPSAQTVSIRFANGVLANFTLQSTSHRTMRTVRVNGTRGSAWGELRALNASGRSGERATRAFYTGLGHDSIPPRGWLAVLRP